ncbi:MAG: hypothetical protein IPK17_13680 [Chloroflexi bacterium]|nr:hypothetical protein [Chloroflexota bacterium]
MVTRFCRLSITTRWSAIYHSDICTPDRTGRNANVMYELGIAHTLGRPVILISQPGGRYPIPDISHRRIITYYSLDNLDELDKNITSVIKSELNMGITQSSIPNPSPLGEGQQHSPDRFCFRRTRFIVSA